MARKIDDKQRREPVPTIIGAGITEQWYFTHLQTLFGYRIKIRPRFFGREDIQSVEKKIKTIVEDGGRAICVFDADVSAWDEVANKRLDKLKKRYAKSDKVLLCDSFPSIEYWFLLHYVDTNRYFGTSKAVIGELKKHQPKFDKTESFLKNVAWVSDLESDGRIQMAEKRAEGYGEDGESYSNVWKAIDKIKK